MRHVGPRRLAPSEEPDVDCHSASGYDEVGAVDAAAQVGCVARRHCGPGRVPAVEVRAAAQAEESFVSTGRWGVPKTT